MPLRIKSIESILRDPTRFSVGSLADHRIVHRNIKSSKILLRENFRAKLTDFGFARLAADNDSGVTHVSTLVKGTAGYLDPEYLKTYQFTERKVMCIHLVCYWLN